MDYPNPVILPVALKVMKIPKAALHILAWCVYVLIYSVLWRTGGQTIAQGLVTEIALLPFKILLVYTSLFFLIPRFLFQRKYYQFILLFLVCSMVFGVLHQVYVELILPDSIRGRVRTDIWNWSVLTKRITYINSTALFAIAIEMVKNWYTQKDYSSKIAREKAEAELKLLKNQLHPHFFFNTLNNLYGLSLIKSDRTPQLILQLADLMRFIVTKSDHELVWLNEEIDFITNYIAMERVRYEDKVSIEFNNRIPLNNCIQIPPLVLITFIENAFKHGVSQERGMARLSVLLEVRNNDVHYNVTNSVVPADNIIIPKRAIKGGIGLENLAKRLDLIFGKNYSLEVRSGSNYTADLHIPVQIR